MYEYDVQARKSQPSGWLPNLWDLIAFAATICFFYLLSDALSTMVATKVSVSAQTIDLSLMALPRYAWYSVVRMFLALLISLLVTFVLGTLAARSAFWERIIIPMIDILQSLPILGWLTVAAMCVVRWFPANMLGFELVALFAIFTSQVWNMILSFYQSLRMVPEYFEEAAAVMRLSRLQKFWRIDVPFAMPDLLTNIMLSLSAGWFYVMESEAILVDNQHVLLPGVGSYMHMANQTGDGYALLAAFMAMFLVILAYDQLLFRPILHWIRTYEADEEGLVSRSWLVRFVSRTRWFRWCMGWLRWIGAMLMMAMVASSRNLVIPQEWSMQDSQRLSRLQQYLLLMIVASILTVFMHFVVWNVDVAMLSRLLFLGACTGLRIVLLLIFCVLLWVPVGVWIGFRVQISDRVLPVLQFLAAFPPNLLYPVLMEIILRQGLNVEIWCAPLMLLGTQWYILFNVITAIRSIPKDWLYAQKTLRLRGWLRWKKLIIPVIAPHLVTGSMAAAGGAWNVSIVTEVIRWHGKEIHATGLGTYISLAAADGKVVEHISAVVVMCLYVVVLNRLFWYPLCRMVMHRYKIT